MRVIKPFSASVLTRTFEYRRKQYLGISVLLFSPMGGRPWLLPEKEMWPFWAAQPEAQGPLDEGFPRRHAEYLVCGCAYTTEQRREAVAVRAQLGKLSKDLVVWGERAWEAKGAGAAMPFESLRLGWGQTYGGADYASNPVGMGRAEIELDGRRWHPLPRIEYPHAPLTSASSTGVPAAMGPIDMMWQQRAELRGTYDAAWLKTDYPGLASDVDWRFFNIAPRDQQLDGYFQGDEAYAFQNMHPSKPLVDGRLPGVATRVFTHRNASGQVQFEEVRTRLTAVWFFPGDERLIQVFQGALEVVEDDASDISLLMVAVERIGQPRATEHYQAVRDKRMDKRTGALETLRESDLAPGDITAALHDFTPSPNRGLDRAMRRAEMEREAARADVAAVGLNPDEHAPPVKAPEPPSIRSIDDLIEISSKMVQEGAEMSSRMAAEKAKTLAETRSIFEKGGWDFGLIESEVAGKLTSGPPKPMSDGLATDFSALVTAGRAGGGNINELEQMLADPKVTGQWRDADAAQLKAYRENAQHQHAASLLSPEASTALRARVVASHAAKQSMAGWDLTGADLSGLDLHGADLRKALLEAAVLRHCNLAGASLDEALLVRSRIESTSLEAASLVGANLSAAHIENSSLKGADLRNCIIEKTVFEKVDLAKTRIDNIRLQEVQFNATDFSHARSESMLVFKKQSLKGTRFKGADFKQVVFIECDLSGVDLSGSQFGKMAFVTTCADGARFKGMVIGAGCFAMSCSLLNADFSGAQMEQVCLRGTPLMGANFSGARVRNSDFSECDLRGAKFHAADARGARFVRTRLEQASLASANLAGAVLQHAWLADTDFRHANLHEADMARVRLGTGVKLDGALVSRTRTLPRQQSLAVRA